MTLNPPTIFPTTLHDGFHAGFHGTHPPLPPLPLPPLQPAVDPADPADPPAPPLTARQQYALNHRQVLATVRGKRFMWSSVSMVVATVVFVLLGTVAPWFHIKDRSSTYYCRDNFLWVFLIPPLACLPLLFSSTPHMRLCWWHCWTVTVISVCVPAVVVFVSFASSLVYNGTGSVLWSEGAFFVLLSYITSIMGGLLYMKLAHLIEVGVPRAAADAAPPPGPITVCIQADTGEKYEYDDVDFRKSLSPGSAVA